MAFFNKKTIFLISYNKQFISLELRNLQTSPIREFYILYIFNISAEYENMYFSSAKICTCCHSTPFHSLYHSETQPVTGETTLKTLNWHKNIQTLFNNITLILAYFLLLLNVSLINIEKYIIKHFSRIHFYRSVLQYRKIYKHVINSVLLLLNQRYFLFLFLPTDKKKRSTGQVV